MIEQGKVKTTLQTGHLKPGTCFHCGESCRDTDIESGGKHFCCDGCRLVYELLDGNSMCTYYSMNATPGISPGEKGIAGKYGYLDLEEVSSKLLDFDDGHTATLVFYIPGIHCSSCIWLLENLHRLNEGIISCQVNFNLKEINIRFDRKKVSLSVIAELLSGIGYEPLVNLEAMDREQRPVKKFNKQVVKIGIAGFCFGNIMMLSFPEYFSMGQYEDQAELPYFFATLNLLLALPVFFYAASGFFVSAWKSLRHGYLNIDAPIALAIIVTFSRSVYEILSRSGAGYLDSMSGIVFFMLLGRYFQDRTYKALSFERDYRSYFPMGVSVLDAEGKEKRIPVSRLVKGDRMMVRNSEIIPADSILMSPATHVDNSFITGEAEYIKRIKGQLVNAGARQMDGAVELLVTKSVSQSYLTRLWNQDEQSRRNLSHQQTYIDRINKYFTLAVLLISVLSASYWLMTDHTKALDAFTAVLIVACPCGLLLTSTFANGNLLRIFGRNRFYLRNASVIDQLGSADTIIFDKTGTITHGSKAKFTGKDLSAYELRLVSALASQSSHPLSRRIHEQYPETGKYSIERFKEIQGNGLKAIVDGRSLVMGSEYFVTGLNCGIGPASANVFLMIDGKILGYFSFENVFRPGLQGLMSRLSETYDLGLLSGDNDAERRNIENLMGNDSRIFFGQKPEQKMQHIRDIQSGGHKVVMIGDGLNDAGALKQSDVGIAVSDDTNNFSPACDAILDGSSLKLLPDLISMARSGKHVIIVTFFISLVYNLIGLLFAVQGALSPVVAAILMPVSSVSIVLLVTVSTNVIARARKL